MKWKVSLVEHGYIEVIELIEQLHGRLLSNENNPMLFESLQNYLWAWRGPLLVGRKKKDNYWQQEAHYTTGKRDYGVDVRAPAL